MDPKHLITMDPNEILRRLRLLLAQHRMGLSDQHPNNDLDQIEVLFSSLDGWLLSGGFLPKEWQWPRPAPSRQ
jgi:hypothetical protein